MVNYEPSNNVLAHSGYNLATVKSRFFYINSENSSGHDLQEFAAAAASLKISSNSLQDIQGVTLNLHDCWPYLQTEQDAIKSIFISVHKLSETKGLLIYIYIT